MMLLYPMSDGHSTDGLVKAREKILDMSKSSSMLNAGLVLSLAIILLTEYQIAVPPASRFGSLGLFTPFLTHHIFTVLMLETVAVIIYVLTLVLYWGHYTGVVMTTKLDNIIPTLDSGIDDLARLTRWYDRKVAEGHLWILFGSHRGIGLLAGGIALFIASFLAAIGPPWKAWYAVYAIWTEPIVAILALIVAAYYYRSDNRNRR